MKWVVGDAFVQRCVSDTWCLGISPALLVRKAEPCFVKAELCGSLNGNTISWPLWGFSASPGPALAMPFRFKARAQIPKETEPEGGERQLSLPRVLPTVSS